MAKENNNKNNNRKGKTTKKKKEQPRVLYNWPGFSDVLNRPKTAKEKTEFGLGMIMEGRGHEVVNYQLSVERYELELRQFLANIDSNDRVATMNELDGMRL